MFKRNWRNKALDQKTKTGYRGYVLKALENSSCEIGDILRVEKEDKVFEGILIPRSESGDDKHVVIKLKNGYNLGIKVTSETIIKRIGKGTKPSFAIPSIPKQNPNLPEVVILSTGGTIASRVDYRTGAVRSALSARDLYGVVPELSDIARIKTEIVFSLYSENITQTHWSQLAKKIEEHISQGVNGVVVAHGTDTMAYTAAALSFALQDLPVPVIFVGAQRSSDRPSSDAALNLIGAVKVASRASFAEVAIAMHENLSDEIIVINRGTKVRKCHTSRRDTFKPVNASPLAKVAKGKITVLAKDFKKRNPLRKMILKPKFSESAVLVKFYPGFDPKVIDWHVKNGVRGLILEGTGLGHVSKYCFESIENAIVNGVVVGLASQCIWGRVNMHVYDTGRDLLNIGVIPLEDMFPETALVKLMWVLGQTEQPEEAKKLLKTNIIGEFSSRTLPDEILTKGGCKDVK
ncbi:MAG: Glu-tRNA(Gln) amidotransferase subunit GatD [Candidatus Bathyarchaeota archaeon]|nr:Glu-tRNA(Gln) amidotransferase subunit GatD [Candidatus Bathyarchaeota archaeon]